MSKYNDYINTINTNLWGYALQEFSDRHQIFDVDPGTQRPEQMAKRPPVLGKEAADENVLLPPSPSSTIRTGILESMPKKEQHRWYRSMRLTSS